VEPAAERRHEVRGLPGIHNVDLHALTDQREQGGEGLVEGHGRWIVAEWPATACRVVPTTKAGPACVNTRPLAPGQVTSVPVRGKGIPLSRLLDGEDD
jgi:hypothetical protein